MDQVVLDTVPHCRLFPFRSGPFRVAVIPPVDRVEGIRAGRVRVVCVNVQNSQKGRSFRDTLKERMKKTVRALSTTLLPGVSLGGVLVRGAGSYWQSCVKWEIADSLSAAHLGFCYLTRTWMEVVVHAVCLRLSCTLGD